VLQCAFHHTSASQNLCTWEPLGGLQALAQHFWLSRSKERPGNLHSDRAPRAMADTACAHTLRSTGLCHTDPHGSLRNVFFFFFNEMVVIKTTAKVKEFIENPTC
jgi:hypothetical protein